MWKISEKTNDKEAFHVFLKHLRKCFEQKDLLLTASFSGSLKFFSKKYDFSPFNECFDLIHINQLCFDEHCWSLKTVNYGFDELKPSAIQEKVDKLIKWGLSSTKIVLCLQFGGPYAVAKRDQDINEVKIKKIYGYNSICEIIAGENGWYEENLETEERKVIVLKNFSGQKREEIETLFYGDSRIIANHIRFAVNRNLAGAMGFLLEFDDFNGKCWRRVNNLHKFDDFIPDFKGIHLKFPERKEGNFPLLRTINEALSLGVYVANERKKIEESKEKPNTPEEKPNTPSVSKPNKPNGGKPDTATSSGGENKPENGSNQSSSSDTNQQNTQGGGKPENKPGSGSSFIGNPICMVFILVSILMSSVLSL